MANKVTIKQTFEPKNVIFFFLLQFKDVFRVLKRTV